MLEGPGNLSATVGSRFKNTDFLHNDIGIMTAHLVLAAGAAGLSTCILGWRSEKKLREILGLSEKVRIPISLPSAMRRKDMRSAKRSVSPLKTPFLLSVERKTASKNALYSQ